MCALLRSPPFLTRHRLRSSVPVRVARQHANASDDSDFIPFRQSYAATALGRVGRDSLASRNSAFRPYEEPHMLRYPHGPGFIPLQLGDRLDAGKYHRAFAGRYEVVRKLGYGTTSTVWLAKDLFSPDRKFVAIKVLSMEASSRVFHYLCHEWKICERIMRDESNHPGRDHVPEVLAIFIARSYSAHVAIVTPPYSISLAEFQAGCKYPHVPLPYAKHSVKQLLLALDYLHSLGYVHTDIKADNLLFSLDSVENLDDKIMHFNEKEEPPLTYPPQYAPEISEDPIITPVSSPLPLYGASMHLRLVDFGSAVRLDQTETGQCVMPIRLRAPEIILSHPWSTPVDIWSVGCMLTELLTSSIIFDITRLPDESFTDVHLARISELVGPYPAGFLNRCEMRAEYFDDTGALLRTKSVRARPGDSLEKRLSTSSAVPPEELATTCAFIRRCLAIDPRIRPSALELLKDEWFSDTD